VTSNPLAQSDHPFYVNSDELVVTRGLDPVAASPCQRTLLPREQTWPTHHIGGHLGRMLDGTLCALVAGGEAVSRWMSPDGGRTWQPGVTDLLGVGAFAVLGDDTFLAAAGGGEEAIRILRSIDRGGTWEQVSRLPLGVFDAMHVDGNMLQLRDGTVLLAANMRINPPEGEGFAQGHYPQYLFRSSNGGETWEGGGDPDFWQAVRDGMETIEDNGPEYSWPGVGGTFPGVYETGFFEPTDGPLLGAFRFSGPPRPSDPVCRGSGPRRRLFQRPFTAVRAGQPRQRSHLASGALSADLRVRVFGQPGNGGRHHHYRYRRFAGRNRRPTSGGGDSLALE
jgi:hypothetical protein